MRLFTPAAAAAIAMALLCAGGAQAAQRYASPTGSGTTCSQAAPCELKEAIKKAKANDEVIVEAGSYTVTEGLYPEGFPEKVYIHGDLAGPMPQISGALPGGLISSQGTGSRIAYLSLTNSQATGFAGVCGSSGTLERVRAKTSGEGGYAIRQESDCTVRDSLAIATGTNSVALAVSGFVVSTATARNVTAIATGAGSKAIVVSCAACFPPFSETLEMKNVIAEGVASDLETTGSEAKAIVGNSNLTLPASPPAAVTSLGGNQTAPPLFVNAVAGDYREAAGSPTIDAGATDKIGTLDLEGNPRTVGSAPDIGAYEFVPPPAPVGVITSLAIRPKAFRTLNAGGATFSKAGEKARGPVGATVTYGLTAAGTAAFTVEKPVPGRRIGKKCKPQTSKNKMGHKKCSLFKPLKGGFAQSGNAGVNSFKFSGRPTGKALAPGGYRLVGSAGGAKKTARFTIGR
jgi:hypothetical protein